MSDFRDPIDLICAACGGSETSGMRSVKHNKFVDGVPSSLHLIGLAVDLIFDSHEGRELAQAMATRVGFLVLDEGDHLHIQAT